MMDFWTPLVCGIAIAVVSYSVGYWVGKGVLGELAMLQAREGGGDG